MLVATVLLTHAPLAADSDIITGVNGVPVTMTAGGNRGNRNPEFKEVGDEFADWPDGSRLSG